MKIGVNTYSPVTVGLARMFFASTVLLPFLFKFHKKVPRSKFKYLALVGLFGNFLPAIFFAIAVPRLGSSVTGVLNALTPLVTFVVGIVFFSVGTRKMQVLGVLVGFGGSLLISLTNSSGNIGGLNLNALFVFAANTCYAFSLNIIKTKLHDIKSLILTSCSITLTWPLAVIGLFFTPFFQTEVNTASLPSFLSIIFLGVIGTSIALVVFNKVIKLTSALFASTVTYLVPVVAIAIGLVVGEQVFIQHILGMGLILVGQIIVTKAAPKPVPKTN
jgi:drug/metabolite transporter (DMT)-like permease